jgi:hypothetical protein
VKPRFTGFGEIVDVLEGSIAHMSLVPGGDLVSPTRKRSSRRAHLDGAVRVFHVFAESLHKAEREVAVAVSIEVAHHLFGLPDRSDVTIWVTGT